MNKPEILYDLNTLLKSSRRMLKKRYFDSLTPVQQANLAGDCEEIIKSLRALQSKARKSMGAKL